MKYTIGSAYAQHLTDISSIIHQCNRDAGWYTDIQTGEALERNIPEMLCLIHSEISEALEAHRKDLKDDHLPHLDGVDVELADAVIRIFDLAGFLDIDIGAVIDEKFMYNQQRADHKIENRLKEGGKKI